MDSEGSQIEKLITEVFAGLDVDGLLDLSGDKVARLSKSTVAYNTSQSYEVRNPTAIVVPGFIQVNGLEITHTNSSY